MELDDFKNILQSKNNSKEKEPEFSLADLKKKKSTNPVEKLKKKITIEYLIGIPLLIIMDVAVVIFNEYLNSVTVWTFIVFSILVAIFSGRFLLKTRKQLKFNEETIEFLQKFKRTFETYLKLAERSVLIIVPLFYFLGYITGVQWAAPEEYMEAMFEPKSMIIMIIVLIVITLGYYKLVQLIYGKLYRKNLNEIQQIIDELNKSNEN